jgi:predicted DNA-binding ribbon-helix-helix protein
MPTKNPRINVVLEKPTYEAIKKIARNEGVSISLIARDLLRDALEVHEDILMGQVATEREKGLKRRKALSHEEVWSDS